MTNRRRALPLALCFAAATAAQQPVDLLATLQSPAIALYRPELPAARIVVLRTDEEARAFAVATWREDKRELHVDFAREQVVALCWGPRRVDTNFRGGAPDIVVERAFVDDQVLRLTVRTLLPLGKRSEPAAGTDCRVWYPAVFLRTPATERVDIDVVGARCRDRTTDFRPVTGRELEVRVGPDAMHSRADVELVDPNLLALPADPAASIEVEPTDHGTRLVIDWGEHPEASYRLDVTEVLIEGDVARVAARAFVWQPMIYSGPPVLRPRLCLDLPPVKRVLLRIDRVGSLTTGDARDFAPKADKALEVAVDRSAAEGVRHSR